MQLTELIIGATCVAGLYLIYGYLQTGIGKFSIAFKKLPSLLKQTLADATTESFPIVHLEQGLHSIQLTDNLRLFARKGENFFGVDIPYDAFVSNVVVPQVWDQQSIQYFTNGVKLPLRDYDIFTPMEQRLIANMLQRAYRCQEDKRKHDELRIKEHRRVDARKYFEVIISN